jgi:hypothetical protein
MSAALTLLGEIILNGILIAVVKPPILSRVKFIQFGFRGAWRLKNQSTVTANAVMQRRVRFNASHKLLKQLTMLLTA